MNALYKIRDRTVGDRQYSCPDYIFVEVMSGDYLRIFDEYGESDRLVHKNTSGRSHYTREQHLCCWSGEQSRDTDYFSAESNSTRNSTV
jgi:hypothetical protein